jgi:protein tyrosine phosphatase (PTP) superfamily phosphohydrolase (DUF442 family)
MRKVSGIRITFSPFQQTRIAMKNVTIMQEPMIDAEMPFIGFLVKNIAIAIANIPANS